MEKISIIIPAYNEEKRIGKTLENYSSFFKNLRDRDFDYEILVVINNTCDKTEEIVKNFQKKDKNISYLNFKQGGKGFAVLEGFKEALKKEKDYVGFVDADMATPPESFYKLFKNIKGCDGVIANRYHKKSKIQTSKKRRVTSRGFNFVVRSLMVIPFKDTQCGAKLFTKRAILEILEDKNETQWAFDVNLLHNLYKKGYKIKSVPTIWKDVEGSKLNLTRVPLKMFSSVVRLRLRKSPFRFMVRAYDLLPEKIKFHHN
jgi:glycosyltransferase involved in cell wall biosynthesis